MNEFEIRNRKPNIQKLLSFGFSEQKDCYTYSADLMDNRMKMTVAVTKDGKVSTRVIDIISEEEYVLHRVQSAVGAFVGQVRAEYEAVLDEISAKCFDLEVFKTEQAKRAIAYIRDTYSDELEFLWKTTNNAIARRKDNQKWYAAFITASRRKLGLDSDETVEIIDLRMKPEEAETVVDNKKYFRGYHMNKRHWITVCFDESVPFEEICARIDDSYILAKKK